MSQSLKNFIWKYLKDFDTFNLNKSKGNFEIMQATITLDSDFLKRYC